MSIIKSFNLYFFSRLILWVCLSANSFGCQEKVNEIAMFHGDGAHKGVYNSLPVDYPLTMEWKFKTGGSINSSGAVSGGRIYFGSDDGVLYCVDLKTGKEIWRFQTSGPIQSSPAVIQGGVYFGSHDGVFYKLNAGNGELNWKFVTEGERDFSARGLHGRTPKDSFIPAD